DLRRRIGEGREEGAVTVFDGLPSVQRPEHRALGHAVTRVESRRRGGILPFPRVEKAFDQGPDRGDILSTGFDGVPGIHTRLLRETTRVYSRACGSPL